MSSGKQVVVIDSQTAGVAGDMILAALLDLGANSTKVVEAMDSVKDFIPEYKNLEITVRDVTRKGMRAKKVDVKAEEVAEMPAQRLIEATINCVENLKLSERAKSFVSHCINTLVNAEVKIHGETVSEVHLHEAGLADTPAEIIGTAVALEDLSVFGAKIYSMPVAVGGGLFKFSHGTVSSPAPATIEILRSKRFPMIGGPVESELTTPTGASMLVNLAHKVVRFYPLMKPVCVGYGAGTKDFTEMPNILRITLGESLNYQLLKDEVTVLETNVDDVSGEIIGYTVDRLLQEGAKDVSVIPMFTKKNRPGQVIRIIADNTDAERFIRMLMEETGSLGVRVYPCERRVLNRESLTIDIQIEGIKELVRVKVARDRKGEIVQIKPEYDDIKRVADNTKKSLREIAVLARTKAREILSMR